MGKNHQASKQQVDDWISFMGNEVVPKKSKRIEKRLAKRKRREERKPAKKRVKTTAQLPPPPSPAPTAKVGDDTTRSGISSKQELRALSERISSARWLPKTSKEQHLLKLYSTSGLPNSNLGKKKLNLQPRRSDYGGLGLAKPSLWISLEGLWQPMLEEEFAEHVNGFFGKQRTKAMKKQLDGNMLWRRRLAEKKERESSVALHSLDLLKLGRQSIND